MRIAPQEMRDAFFRVLRKYGYDEEEALLSARLFTQATQDGVASHGLNKFPQLIEYIQNEWVRPQAKPLLIYEEGSMEQWDGQQGPGDCQAHFAMNRAILKAKETGLGLIGLRNTNHWMRPGNYGWQAIEADCIGICWSNTAPNMVAWGTRNRIFGNNPLVIAIPDPEQPLVLDMAMSQFSYGKMSIYEKEGRSMPYPTGYDQDWQATTDPSETLQSGRVMPAGYWKGSGLSLMLDLLAAILSNGKNTREVGEGDWETNLSQVFLAIDPRAPEQKAHLARVVQNTLSELLESAPIQAGGGAPRYPGQSTLQAREKNGKEGIPVDPDIWRKVKSFINT